MTQTLNSNPKTNGRWTKEQHQKFLLGLEIHGKDWKKIQEFIGTRNGAQIRSHAQKFFLRMKKQFDLDLSNEHPRSQEHTPAQSPQNPIETKKSQETKEYSYFVEKIVKKSHEEERFNFWEAFVDQKSDEDMNEMETGMSKRKSSFIVWDENELELMQTGEPVKRVKSQ